MGMHANAVRDVCGQTDVAWAATNATSLRPQASQGVGPAQAGAACVAHAAAAAQPLGG